MQIGAGMPALLIFKSLQKTGDAQQEQFAKSPMVKRDVDYFLNKIKDIETPEELFKDPRLLKVALGAYGLEGEANYTARIKAIMTEDPEDKQSLVNKLVEPRYKEIAKDFDMFKSGVAKLKDEDFVQGIVDRYLTNEFEKNLGGGNTALREAAYFRRKVAEADSVYELMGDKVLRSVITDTLRIPKEIVNQGVERQAKVIESKVKAEDFKDPKFVDKFLERFLLQKDAEAQMSGMGGVNMNTPGALALQLLQGSNLNILV
ncbi:MAG: DUF1217 domain-containing protein [Alphaproteobacteria bacterium]|nr:DUF1217 domain-containing protein [Alphaproteobacteria bacterium]MBU0886152.1 DUF1217 domain-containing protein [Alphaproteobacteria bacterium]MBU1812792.1 DUF1217 domain-containing protein [Alphaproteobacteria bacterium]MBU2089934.1 DUF1217 domain-containing protein [Alphaproteobacteria bacterium]